MATGNNEDYDIAWISQLDDVSILFDYSPSPPPQSFDCNDFVDTGPPSSKRSKCPIQDATKEPLKESTIVLLLQKPPLRGERQLKE